MRLGGKLRSRACYLIRFPLEKADGFAANIVVLFERESQELNVSTLLACLFKDSEAAIIALMNGPIFTRREFNGVLLSSVAATSLGGCRTSRDSPTEAPGSLPVRPLITDGVQSGDVSEGQAVIWSRSSVPARMRVEYSTTESFKDCRIVDGPAVTPETDLTGKVVLTDLPAGQTIHYRVSFQDLSSPKSWSIPEEGSFRTAPQRGASVKFAWSGDCAGQGFGINPEFGGYKIYAAIMSMEPDFFIHSGDTVYADHPIQAEIILDDGSKWCNLTTEAKSKVSETLDEFRGAFRYNLKDENLLRFNKRVPSIMQADDHEVHNNWVPGEMLDDPRYSEKDTDVLAARAMRAFHEYTPTHPDAGDPSRIFRSFKYGAALEVFRIDLRSYRGSNSVLEQEKGGAAADYLGPAQLAWLKEALLQSKATWKVIASDMPIGLIVPDGDGKFDASANGNGPPQGRERELADLLRFLKSHHIQNVIWLTADVHYAAAHFYDPEKAVFRDFSGFWEFVAGPLNAGTFGPNELDNTFGPDLRFCSVEKGMKPNRPPSEGKQFFGFVEIDGKTEMMKVSLHDIAGRPLWQTELMPHR